MPDSARKRGRPPMRMAEVASSYRATPAPKRGRPPIGVRVPVRFPAATLARIEALAATDGVSRAEMIRRLVDRGLEKQ